MELKKIGRTSLVIIVVALFSPWNFLLVIAPQFRAQGVVSRPEWMGVAVIVVAIFSAFTAFTVYLIEKLLLSKKEPNSIPGPFGSRIMLLFVGSMCSFAPTLYGFILFTLGMSYEGFRVFAVASFLAVVLWVVHWLRQGVHEGAGLDTATNGELPEEA